MGWEADIIMDLARQAGLEVQDYHDTSMKNHCKCFLTAHFLVTNQQLEQFSIIMLEEVITFSRRTWTKNSPRLLDIFALLKSFNLSNPTSIEDLIKEFTYIYNEWPRIDE